MMKTMEYDTDEIWDGYINVEKEGRNGVSYNIILCMDGWMNEWINGYIDMFFYL